MSVSLLLAMVLGFGSAEPAAETTAEAEALADEEVEPVEVESSTTEEVEPAESESPVREEAEPVEAEPTAAEDTEPAEPTAIEDAEPADTEPTVSEEAEPAEAEPTEAESLETRAAEAEEDERESRRRRRANRVDRGQWQVFAPYPELGIIRYRDPEQRRTLWVGADVSGAYVPQSWGLFSRRVWALRPAGSWALALTPWLSLGGRHGMAWYDASNIRVRVHDHQLELSGRPAAASRPGVSFDDRLALGVSTHSIARSDVDGVSIAPGGLRDTILHLGYGLDHLLGTRWRLGWQVQGRYAWVYLDTQRHVRGSARLAFHPRPAHRIALDAVGYYVHRDPDQAGNRLPRHSLYGQFGLGYAWVSQAGVGPWVRARVNTGFMSGEAPVYEIREEALNTTYGEALVGVLARWP